jgi:hypothetical protein
MAVELGIQNIILETDAAAVVQALMATETDRSSASGLLWELKDLLACNFVSSNVSHNPRSCRACMDWRKSKGIMEESNPMERFCILVFGSKE